MAHSFLHECLTIASLAAFLSVLLVLAPIIHAVFIATVQQ